MFLEQRRKDIFTDRRTPLVCISRMDPGQDCLAVNAGQGFEYEPKKVQNVFVQCVRHNIQYLSRLTNVNN